MFNVSACVVIDEVVLSRVEAVLVASLIALVSPIALLMVVITAAFVLGDSELNVVIVPNVSFTIVLAGAVLMIGPTELVSVVTYAAVPSRVVYSYDNVLVLGSFSLLVASPNVEVLMIAGVVFASETDSVRFVAVPNIVVVVNSLANDVLVLEATESVIVGAPVVINCVLSAVEALSIVKSLALVVLALPIEVVFAFDERLVEE